MKEIPYTHISSVFLEIGKIFLIHSSIILSLRRGEERYFREHKMGKGHFYKILNKEIEWCIRFRVNQNSKEFTPKINTKNSYFH